MDITIETDRSKSWGMAHNGRELLTAVQVKTDDDGTLFIEGFDLFGRRINGGFVIDSKAAKILLAEIAECKFDIDAN